MVTPVKTDGVVQFEPWAAGKDVELDVLLAKQSPKEFVFLQTETYLKFGYSTVMPEEGAEGEAALPHEAIAVETLNEAPAQVIFGLRPCDARGFVQTDQVFGGYGGFYFDPLYNARRAATTLLAVTCRDPRSTCFCTAIGGCPAGHEGVDALFTQVDGGFTVETFTEKGEAALARLAGLADATDAQTAEAAEVKTEATAKVDVPFTLEGIRDNLHDNIARQGLARPLHALHLLRHLHVRVPELLLLLHQRRAGGVDRRALPRVGQLLQSPLHRGDLGPQPAGGEVQPVPQPLQPQVLVLPRQIRQPALLGLRPLHHALPDAHRHPRGAAGDGVAGSDGTPRRRSGRAPGRGVRADARRRRAPAGAAPPRPPRPTGRRRRWLTTARPASPSAT